MKTFEYALKAILIGTIAIAAMTVTCLTPHAEGETVAIIYSGLPEGKVEVGIAPGETAESESEVKIAGVESTHESIESTQELVESAHEYSGIHMTASEKEELRRVVAAESQTQSLAGRKAVVEVIFNRVLSSKWPNTVHGVLSQKGQFTTYKMRYAKWVEPEYADAAISAVLANGRTVLPSTSYVYFDTRGVNGKKHIRIGGHYFGS